MKQLIKIFLLFSIVLVSNKSQSQTYKPITVTGFTTHGILSGTDTPTASDAIDGDVGTGSTVSFFYANGYKTYSTNGLPSNGTINSTGNSGVNYSLNYTGNNTLKILPAGTGTLTLSTPDNFTNIWLLGTSGNGSSTLSITVNYTDGTSITTTNYTLPDWVNTSSDSKIVRTTSSGFKRYYVGGTIDDANGSAFYLFDIKVAMDVSKKVSSISINNTASSGSINRANIFAVCGSQDFTKHPQSQNLCVGSNAGLTVELSSATSYQWYSNTSNTTTGAIAISGANSATYTPSTSSASINYYYTVVSSSYGTLTSNIAKINVIAYPNVSITGNTTNIDLVSLTASGADTYSWSGGSTTNTASNTFSQTGTYTLTTTNSSLCTNSSNVNIVVNRYGLNRYGAIIFDNLLKVGKYGQIGSQSPVTKNGKKNL